MTVWDRHTAPQLAVDLIAKVEAFRDRAYPDSTGKMTVGYGTTVMPGGKPVRAGDVLPEPLARALLRQQAGAWCAAIARHIAQPLDECQAASLISFVHNLGEGCLIGSTLAGMLNANRQDLAGWQLGGWVMAGGIKTLGLMRRRELERRMFFGAGLDQYDAVWRMTQVDLEPYYTRSFHDADAWRHGTVSIAPSKAPVPRPASPGPAVSVHAPIAATLSEADRLNDEVLAAGPQVG